MKTFISRCHSRWADDSGQALLLVAFATVAMVGMAAFTVDVGYALNAKKQLQASVDAAATAAAQDLWTKTRAEVTSTALLYSANAGQKNAYANLPGVSTTVAYKCLTTVNLPTPCTNPSTANALTVTSTTTLPMFLARILGVSTMQIRASATSLMKGGAPPPLDVMIIIDTTASMDSTCSASVSGVSHPTKLDCAKAGIRGLLTSLWPCAQSTGACGAATNGHVSNPYDEVGLMTFPGLKVTSQISRQYDCSVNVSPTDPRSNISTDYATWDLAKYSDSPVYLVRSLSSDYKTSASSALNGVGSILVKAVDWTGISGCSSGSYGLESPGGVSTYFADVIAQAHSTLVSSGRSTVQNVIIFVSDGDSQSGYTTTAKANDQCQQAIDAAGVAKAAGTWIYSVAYEASTSSGSSCNTDSPAISAYTTMQRIATDSTKFYNQASAGDLSNIFQKIAADLTTSRLIPDDTQ